MTCGDHEGFRSVFRDATPVPLFARKLVCLSIVSRTVGICAACFLSIIVVLAPIRAYPQEPGNGGVLKGYVRDSSARPVANAVVFLQLSTQSPTPAIAPESTQTDSAGAYRFAALPAAAYTLRVQKDGYAEAIVSRIPLARKEMKKIDLVLLPHKMSESHSASPRGGPVAKPSAGAPEFFDEPQFTVAGVTAGATGGGHGSDTVLRTSEALARETVSLSASSEKIATADAGLPSTAAESLLRNAVVQNPQDASFHHQLADIEEKLGHPLEAVREYQRAAELGPSEPYLFDWGTELLTHRALEPATEVFTNGNRLFPKSVRMLIALGVSWYASGSYDQAVQYLVSASNLAPDDATPYLFLGKMLEVTPTLSKQSVDCLARFVQLQPDNALANYYYAVAIWNLTEKADAASHDTQADATRSAQVEALLQKAVHLDPRLSAAYLQLGIVYSQRQDFSQAVAQYQRAIEVSSERDETLAEAHYRLALAYARTGDTAKAEVELKLHADLDKQIMESIDRERRELQQFVVSLQHGKSTSSQPQP
jgi:tetratricopeptide (TPR) repeat protein